MQIAGIIAEYNPFHLGHKYLIEKTREAGATHIAVVMSGNFVQRGEAAILSKTARTKQALLCGADLVVELPLPWATAGAEKFASGSVFLLDALGAETISFGSECGDITLLQRAAQALLSPLLQEALQKELKTGISFAKARENTVATLFGTKTASVLSQPNNILGVEYLKAMLRQNSKIEPFTVCRKGPAHNASQEANGLSSAGRIREILQSGQAFETAMPVDAARILQEELSAGRAPASLQLAERAVLAKLRTMTKQEFASLPDISEGLENRVYAAVRKATSLQELYAEIKTKRYSLARIRRIVLAAFLGLTAEDGMGMPPYLRILGMNAKGREILPVSKMTTKLPIVTNSSDILSLDNRASNMIELECRFYDLFSLCMPSPAICGMDRTAGVIKL